MRNSSTGELLARRGWTIGAALLVFLVALPLSVGCSRNAEPSATGGRPPSDRAIPPQVLAYLAEAQEAQRRGDYGAALTLAGNAQRQAPELPDVYFLKGNLYADLGRLIEAEAAFRQAVSIDPGYRGAWFNLGNTAFRRGQLHEALTHYQRERERHPSAPVMTQMGRVYARLGEADSARSAFEEALALDSTYAPAHARLGQIYEDEGQLEKALARSRRALALEPENANYQYIVGAQLLRSGSAEAAAAYLHAAASALPWHYGAHYNLGQVLLRLGRHAEAQRYLARADTLQALQLQVEQAHATAQTSPGYPQNWARLGDVLRRSGRLDEAQEAYEVALHLAPGNLALQHTLANLALVRGDTVQAVARYQAVLQQDTTFADAWLNLGVIYALSGEHERARSAWENVLRHAPGDSTAKVYLGQLEDSS